MHQASLCHWHWPSWLRITSKHISAARDFAPEPATDRLAHPDRSSIAQIIDTCFFESDRLQNSKEHRGCVGARIPTLSDAATTILY